MFCKGGLIFFLHSADYSNLISEITNNISVISFWRGVTLFMICILLPYDTTYDYRSNKINYYPRIIIHEILGATSEIFSNEVADQLLIKNWLNIFIFNYNFYLF